MLNSDDFKFISETIKEMKDQYLQDIVQDCQQIYKDNIEKMVYDMYSPTQYVRTYDMENSVTFKLEGDTIFIYNDTNKMDYYSAVTGDSVSGNAVVNYVNYGHNDYSPINNNFHHYLERNFLEQTKEDIENKYNIKVEIVDEY